MVVLRNLYSAQSGADFSCYQQSWSRIKKFHSNLISKITTLCLQTKTKKFHTKPFERLKLVFLSCLDPNWIENLILVSPHTLLEWRNNKFKTFWALLSRKKKTGRPNIPWKVIKLIRRVAKETKSGELQNCTAFF